MDPLDTKLDIRDLVRDDYAYVNNVAQALSGSDRDRIAALALEGFQQDLASRDEWSKRNAAAMELALQVVTAKTFPWPDCSNVKFPLITVAALQYAAKAYPTLISGTEVFRARVIGPDPDGKKTERAKRITAHMSWQALEQDESWEEDMDRALLVQPILGCAFKKSVYDSTREMITTQLVHPRDFVINYWTKDLQTSPRYTHTFNLSPNAVKQRQLDKRFLVYDENGTRAQPQPAADTSESDRVDDKRQGLERPEQSAVTPYFTAEQYCWLDLDHDGIQEPYIVTFDVNSGQLWRIVPRYFADGVKMQDDRVYDVRPVKVFNKIPFIPSPDGGFYDLGLGCLAGPINESVNSAVNQLFDAATMQTLGGGFVGRGFKNRGGPFTFAPHQWHPTDAPGDDLRKNILPLPVREPSKVMFELLGFLVQYAERIVGSTEIQSGENPGQNMKAGTAEILNQNGQRVYSAIHKRTWRALKDEGRIRYDLNRLYITVDKDYHDLTSARGAMITPEDYSESKIDVVPAADPNVVSKEQRLQRAEIIVKNAYSLQGHNKYRAVKAYYEAMEIPNIDYFLPPPQQPGQDGKPQPADDYPPPPNFKMEEIKIKAKAQELKEKEFALTQKEMTIQMKMDYMELQATIQEKMAKAAKLRAEADGVDKGHEIALLEASIGAATHHGDQIMKMIDMLDKHMERSNANSNEHAGMGGVEKPPQDAGVPSGPAQ